MHSYRNRSVWALLPLAGMVGLTACSRKPRGDSARATCLPVTLLPGESYAQDFKGPCHDWFNRESKPVTIVPDDPGFSTEEDTRWLPNVATFTGAETKEGGPFYSSWLQPIQVTPSSNYCLDLWTRWVGGGDGLVFGVRRFGPNQVDLGVENYLMGPAGFSDPQMGPVTPIGGEDGHWVHLKRTVPVPADTAALQVFANIDWQFKGAEDDFAGKQAIFDGVRLSKGPCEGQGFPSACQPADAARGLRGEYFDNSDLTNAKVTRVDPLVAFDWGLRSPDLSIGTDSFSVRWTGSIVPLFSQAYTFYTTSDDGVRLWVNDQPIINDWNSHTATERSGTTAVLQAGVPYSVRLEYFDNTGAASMMLEWQSASQPRMVVPATQLFPAATASCTSSQTLVGHWRFDETSGTTASDSTCKLGHGVLMNFPASPSWLSTGREGGALTFDGASNWVRVPDSAAIDAPSKSNQITVSAWVRRRQNDQMAGTYSMVAMRQSSAVPNHENWALGFHNNKIVWLVNTQTNSSNQCEENVVSEADQWIRLTGTFDGTTARLYRNGTEVCHFMPTNHILAADTTPLAIGAGLNAAGETANEYFKGDLDELVVYDRALSQDEVTSTVEGGVCTPAAGPPEITVPGELLAEEEGFTGQAAVTFTTTAADDPSGAGVIPTCLPGSGSLFPLGTTVVTCMAQSHGLTGSASFKVRVTPRNRGNRVALLVVGDINLPTADAMVKSRLVALGYQVVVKTGSGVAGSDANNKALIVVTETAGNGLVGTKFNNTRVPVVVMNLGLMRDMTLTGDNFQDDKGSALNQNEIEIVTPEHPMAAGYRGRVPVTIARTEFLWGRPATTAIRVATLPGSPDQPVIFGYRTGASLMPGFPTLEAPARRVGFFAGSAALAALSNDGGKLFDAAVIWATESEALLVVESATTPVHATADGLLRSRLFDLGYAVVTKTAAQVQAAQADSAEIVVVSDSVVPSEVDSRLTNTKTPVVALSDGLWSLLKMVNTGSTEIGPATGTQINIIAPTHPLAAGLSSLVSVADVTGIHWGKPAATGTNVATVPGDATKSTIFGYQTGTAMAGLNAPGRRVGWFADADLATSLKPDGWKLFDAAIRWAATREATVAGEYALQAVHSSKCVDVTGGSLADSAALVQMDCTGTTSQRWVLRDLGGSTYEISSVNSNKCADVSGSSTTNGAPIVQLGCSGASSQSWKLTDMGGGLFQVQPTHSLKCMDIDGSSTTNGAAVQQWTCSNGNNQRFRLKPAGFCQGETDAELCAAAGKNCNSIGATDRCGASRTITSCGTCTAPQTCAGAGMSNVCGCFSETVALFCSRLGKNCGSVTAADNCNITRTYNCGTCGGFDTCGGGGTSNICGCTPETLPQFCSRLGKNCGQVSGTDNCGMPRTAPSCGTCTSPQTCGGGGTANVCACAAETNAQFCSRLGKNCGSVTAADNCGTTRTVSSCGTCSGGQVCGGNGTANVCATPACTFNITANSYDGPNWWGTITFRNNGPSTSSHYVLEFDVPSGKHCTNDTVPSGSTLSPLTGSGSTAKTTSNHCIFTWSNGPTLAANASKTINYSTDSNSGSFTSASNVTVSDSSCTVCTPETDSAFCSRLGKNCNSVTAPDNCGTSRTVSSCGMCTSPATCGGSGTANVCGTGGNACAFTVFRNTYSGPDWWGNVDFKNDGPNNASNLRVAFTVPSGAHCDYSDNGWTFTQSGSTCTYQKAGTTFTAGGTTVTLNVSTDSNASSFKNFGNLVVSDTVCTGAKVSMLTVYDSNYDNAGNWAVKSNFQVGSSGAHPWPDYPNSYINSVDSGISASLVGKLWIQNQSNSKNYNPSSSPLAEARITLGSQANVYLLFDNRVPSGTQTTWASAGWTATGFSCVIKENSTTTWPCTIWKKANQTGSVDLPIQNFNGAFNYFVVVE
jgi:hypothetical protein